MLPPEPTEKLDDEQLCNCFKALGNPVRLQIVRHLLANPGCITGDIVKVLPIAQATTSQHLAVLKEAGIIQGTTEGPATCYCLNGTTLRQLSASLPDFYPRENTPCKNLSTN